MSQFPPCDIDKRINFPTNVRYVGVISHDVSHSSNNLTELKKKVKSSMSAGDIARIYMKRRGRFMFLQYYKPRKIKTP